MVSAEYMGSKEMEIGEECSTALHDWHSAALSGRQYCCGGRWTQAAKEIHTAELVWEGQTKQRNFGDMKFKLCPTEGFAREHFKKAGCEHYWDHAYSTAVLANSDEA